MKKQKLTVSIIIPNFETPELLKKNLPAILAAREYKKNNIIEIIVVDDASLDESVALLKSKFPEIKIVIHKVNKGFSASINSGAKIAKGNLLVLLNTDVIPEKSFLTSAIARFKNENVFGVSLHEKGFGWAKGKFKDGYIVHSPGVEDDRVHNTFWVSGGSGVFRRKTWQKLGGLDEKLLSPFYWEDLDICYRALKRGFSLLWDPKANVVHGHEATMSKLSAKHVQRISERNHLLFVWKNLTSPNLFRKHMVSVISRILKHPGYARIVMMALSKLRIVRKLRKKEMKESKISDEAVFSKYK